MRNLVSFQRAVNGLLVMLGLELLFQVAVLLGFVPTHLVWGGNLASVEERTAMALFTIALLILIMVIIARRNRRGDAHLVQHVDHFGERQTEEARPTVHVGIQIASRLVLARIAETEVDCHDIVNRSTLANILHPSDLIGRERTHFAVPP